MRHGCIFGDETVEKGHVGAGGLVDQSGSAFNSIGAKQARFGFFTEHIDRVQKAPGLLKLAGQSKAVLCDISVIVRFTVEDDESFHGFPFSCCSSTCPDPVVGLNFRMRRM